VAAPGPVPATSPPERLLSRYRNYLRAERRLAASTVELNVRMVRPFLTEQLRADGQLDLQRFGASEVGAFVVAQSRRRPRSVGRIVTASRSVVRFLHVEGIIDRPLASAVPPVAGWSLASLPKALGSGQVAALLASCDRETSTGCRDFATPHAAGPARAARRGGRGAKPGRA
jgi:integrase/recombinase XerD